MRPNVLIVDDDIESLEIMSLYLKSIANTATVNGGRQALEYVQQNPVDVILLDLYMPVMNGFQTVEEFRKLKECINVPIILMTGSNDKLTVLNSVVLGVDGFLVKPVQKDVLVQKVMEVYNKRQKERNKRTVLAIDDDMTYLKQINRFLHDSYNVIMINSAKLALEYLLKHTPDVILLDFQMPFYNGATVMNMIRKNTGGKNIPIILLSGVLDREVINECYSCNPAAYLAKPVSKETLIETIERALKQ
ncbi:MAG: response regulator [Clostridiales bacterium]|nr:response regulator [Clostridiales bacterium]